MNAKPAIKFFLRLLPRHPSKGTSTIPIIGNATSAANADCGLVPWQPLGNRARSGDDTYRDCDGRCAGRDCGIRGNLASGSLRGTPKQLNCTAPENPPLAARLKSKFAVPPGSHRSSGGVVPDEIVKP